MTREPYEVAGDIRRGCHEIADYYEAAAMPPTIRDDSATRRGDPDRPPGSIEAMQARSETHRDLGFWTQYILDTVNDGTITTKIAGADIHALITFIDRWALALAEQHPDDAHNAARELRGHGRNLMTIACGIRTKRVEVGPCPELRLITNHDDLEELIRCDGTIFAVLRERDPHDTESGLLPQAITCTATSDHKWQPWQWADVGRRVEARASETA